ncbi:hypothetical protein [Lacipirellula limnantheis]|uniref:PEP-CTERM protein-sorting domain-containing protein n=1 Tax=Lacipirellula limnantheis TaxID=2528024 RepID=A0A517TX57_9BACT|nr:hypothetical protein [Lacipirellula limnantheis]QDT72961.1 hypothetical protein I41_21480 [Lacipirellula limnantheis]
MKQTVLLAAFIATAFFRPVVAAEFVVKPNISLNNVYNFYVDGGNFNGSFDTIFFQAKSYRGSFINANSGASAGVPRPPGDLFTYPNRMLTADPLDFPGGLALTQVGLINNGQELSFTVGKLGGTITTAAENAGDLFLGNVMMSSGGGFSYQIQLISAGNVLYDTGINTIPLTDPTFPEPSGLVIAAVGMVGLLSSRRLRRPQG